MPSTPIRVEARSTTRQIAIYRKTCPACGAEFEAPIQRLYCSTPCRMRQNARDNLARAQAQEPTE